MAKISRFSVPPPTNPWRAQYPSWHVPPDVAALLAQIDELQERVAVLEKRLAER